MIVVSSHIPPRIKPATMALDPSFKLAKALQCPSPTIATRHNLFAGLPNPNPLLLRSPLHSSALAFARRRSTSQSNTPCKKQDKQKLPDEDLGEDAFEALFKQLEEDLKNDGPSISEGEDDITEEDFAQFEHELAEAAGEDELFGALNEIVGNEESGDDLEEYNEDSEEVTPVKLKNWQLRKLAYALKTGRRKTNIKSLAADVCLDRAVVLQLLRDPPPNLLMMSAALPDEPERTVVVSKTKPKEVADVEALRDALKAKTTAKTPVHVMQRQWSAQKRLKKVQVQTLEIVYGRTQRPTNAMISSIVHVTNLPRKRVVKWFEDKRAEAGVPKQRLPFRGSTSETAEPVV